MYDFPLKHFEDNLIFDTNFNECWAVFKMTGYNYDFKSNETKIDILNSMARFLSNIGIEAAIWIVPVSQNVEKHYKRLISNINKKDIFYKQAKSHALQTQEYLKARIANKGNADDYKVYILTKIRLNNSIIDTIKDAFQYLIKDPIGTINSFMNVGIKEIYEKDIEMFMKLSDEYYRKQNRRFSISKCTPADIEWLIRRPMYRGLNKDIKLKSTNDNYWTPYTEVINRNGQVLKRASGAEILNLIEGEIDLNEKRCIKIDHEFGTSYQTFATVAHIPDDMRYPGCEWLLHLQDFPIQTETIIRIRIDEHKESVSNIEKKKKEIDDQIDHITKSDDELPEELLLSRDSANDLRSELKATRAPLMDVKVTFCLYADNKEELEIKYNFIKETYEDNNFIIERPISDQMKLFMESIPGTPRYTEAYSHKMPPRTFAGAVIGATRLIGDNIGQYIGTTGPLRKPVYLTPAVAPKLNRSASALFNGTLGGGKSYAANLLFYLAVLYGAYGLVIDPKGERSNWIDDLPEFSGEINISTLSADEEDRGKLDPFIIYRDNLAEAEYLALSIISEMFGIGPRDDEYTAILLAISELKTIPNPGMLKLIELLMNSNDEELGNLSRRMGRKMQLLSTMSMAGLLFGTGEEKGLDFKKRINIIQIQNLNMPKPDKLKEEYTQEELLSTVLMIPIASFARKFLHQDRSVFKVVEFDEAWALESTSAGRQMMSALIREGRALNAGCFFISQGVGDLKDDAIKTNISYKFCFRAQEINEIKSVLEFLDLEITDENIDTVRNLETGECLFQDLEGRVGILNIDVVFEHLKKKAFNTNPDKVIKEVV